MKKIETDHLIIDFKDRILELILNRPDSLNAFSQEMILGLTNALIEAKKNEEVRVITISGIGRSFSAGGDIKGMGKGSTVNTYEHFSRLNELIKIMRDVEKPIIAAVHGYAAGAGFSLALASDIILAEEESKFVLSFSKVGLVPDAGAFYFLPRLIGPYRAKEIFFRAEPISDIEAASMGIVNHIYPKHKFKSKVNEFAINLANGPSKAYGFIKKLTNQSFNSNLDEVLEQERMSQVIIMTTEDHHEGVRAFKEKRKPNFKGR